MSGLTSQAEWEKHFRSRSGVLNPTNLYDKQGRPTSSNSFSFTDGKEYLEELVSLRRDTFGPKGLIEIAKEKLKTAKSDWQYRMDARLTPKTPPKGQALIDINRLNARLKVYREEARTINAKFQKEEKSDDAKLSKQQRKRAGQGGSSLKDGLINSCDLRPVIYKEGIPVFEDDGSDVMEYLAECKAAKREKAKAEAKALRLEQAEIERVNSQKIAHKKKAVETQLLKIKRRRQESAAVA